MRITTVCLGLIYLSGCGQVEQRQSTNQATSDSIKTNTSALSAPCIHKDIITASGTRIQYLFRNGKFQLSWGDGSYKRTYDSLYTCENDAGTGLWDFVPTYYSETKNHLIFTNVLWTSGGTNPAPLEYYTIICPKSSAGSIIEKAFFISAEGNYLIYVDEDNELVHVYHIEENRSQKIALTPKPFLSRSPTLSIKETKIKGGFLFITYEALGRSGELITINQKVKMEI